MEAHAQHDPSQRGTQATASQASSMTATQHDERPAVFTDILCAVDGTRASFTAVRQAVSIAGPNGSLTLLAVSATAGAGAYRTAAIDPARIKRVLDIATHLAREGGVRCNRIIDPDGPPSRVIVQRAAGHDLLAMGAPTTSWLGGLFVGGVVVSAMRSFTTPLLLARPAPEEQPFGRRTLVASDAGEDSDGIVGMAAALARQHDGGVMLVHALGPESKARPHRVSSQIRMLEAELQDACESHIEPGPAHEVILEIARSAQASLIVMGSRRLGGLKALGSVSERVVHEAPCSVLVVPPSA